MHKYRDNLQHYITFLQNKKNNGIQKTPTSFVFGGAIVLICFLIFILGYIMSVNYWKAIIMLMLSYIVGLTIPLLCKDEDKRLFFKIELQSIAFFLSISTLLYILSRFIENSSTYVIVGIISSTIIGLLITQIIFAYKIKNDYYLANRTKNSEAKAGVWIVGIIMIMLGIVLRFIPKNITMISLAILCAIVISIFGIFIIRSIRNMLIVIALKLNISSDIDQ